MRLSHWLTILCLIVTVIQAFAYYDSLPEKMAAHFDSNGQPNGWMSKATFFIFMFIVQFGIAGLLVGVGKIMHFLPDSLINIPNKEYWLAACRREKTLSDQTETMGWIAVLSAAFLIGIIQLTILANFSDDRKLNMLWTGTLLLIYLVMIFGICLRLVFRYYGVAKSEQN